MTSDAYEFLGYRPNVSGGDAVIYFVTAEAPGYPVKIGTTSVVRLFRRLQFLQTSMPFDRQVLFVELGGKAEEREYHYRFWSDRLRGEWFERSDALMALVEELRGRDPDWAERFRVDEQV